MSDVASMRGHEQAWAVVGEYAGADSIKTAVAAILATETLYIEEMIDAKPERVAAIQQNIRQLRALRRVLEGKGGTPKI